MENRDIFLLKKRAKSGHETVKVRSQNWLTGGYKRISRRQTNVYAIYDETWYKMRMLLLRAIFPKDCM